MIKRCPELVNVLICDDVREEVSYKTNYIGVYRNDILLPSMPFTFAKLFFVETWRGEGEFACKQVVFSPSHKSIGSFSFPNFYFQNQHTPAISIIAFQNLKIDDEGVYSIKAYFDDESQPSVQHPFNICLHPDARWSKAVALMADGDFDEAISEFKRIQRSYPNYCGVLMNLARIYGKKGEFDVGREVFEESLKLGWPKSKYEDILNDDWLDYLSGKSDPYNEIIAQRARERLSHKYSISKVIGYCKARDHDISPEVLYKYEQDGLIGKETQKGSEKLYTEQDIERVILISNLERILGRYDPEEIKTKLGWS